MPMPRAASTTSGSTWRIAVYVLIRIGGNASNVSANRLGAKPVPRIGITSASTASEGTVRPMFAVAIAHCAARREPASATPAGTAIATAMASADADSAICVHSADRKRSGWATMNCQASTKDVHSASPPHAALEPRQRPVGADRQRARGQRPGPDLGRVVARDAAEDQRPQPARVHVRGDHGDADHRHGRNAQPCDDHRQCERQLDPAQDLAGRSSPSPSPRPRPRAAPRGCRRRRCGRGS